MTSWGVDEGHPDELLALLAVDALDPVERRGVVAHVESCDRCRAGLAAHHETLATLTPDAEPPAADWDGIAARLHGPPATAVGPARWGRVRDLAPWLAAAAVLAAAVLSLALIGRDGAAATLDRVAAAALRAPDSRVVALLDGSGAPVARAVLTPGGASYVFLDGLAGLDRDRAYQLWKLDGGDPVSLGLLGDGSTRVAALRVPAGTRRVAISAEPSGGAPAPTGPVVASADVDA